MILHNYHLSEVFEVWLRRWAEEKATVENCCGVVLPNNLQTETTRKASGKAFIHTEGFVPKKKDRLSSLGKVSGAERMDQKN